MDLSLNAGTQSSPTGVTRLQVESFVLLRSRVALSVLLTGASLAGIIGCQTGCHRPPSADVVASVNGKDLMRAELDRNYKISLGGAPQKPSPEEADIRRLTILHQMIADEVLEQRAAKLLCANHLEQISLATRLYALQHGGRLPDTATLSSRAGTA